MYIYIFPACELRLRAVSTQSECLNQLEQRLERLVKTNYRRGGAFSWQSYSRYETLVVDGLTGFEIKKIDFFLGVAT